MDKDISNFISESRKASNEEERTEPIVIVTHMKDDIARNREKNTLDDVEKSLESNKDIEKENNTTEKDNEIQGNGIIDPINYKDEDNKIDSANKDDKNALENALDLDDNDQEQVDKLFDNKIDLDEEMDKQERKEAQ